MKIDLLKSLKEKTSENVSEMAMSVLGVALLLMMPRNLLHLPYWIAVAAWVSCDLTSRESRLEKIADMM